MKLMILRYVLCTVFTAVRLYAVSICKTTQQTAERLRYTQHTAQQNVSVTQHTTRRLANETVAVCRDNLTDPHKFTAN